MVPIDKHYLVPESRSLQGLGDRDDARVDQEEVAVRAEAPTAAAERAMTIRSREHDGGALARWKRGGR